MITFVGAEYIIANLLIALKRTNKKASVTLSELSEAGIYIQKMSLSNNIDAIFLSSAEQVATAIYDFSDYFEYDRETKQIEDLESRFMGYLPFNILSFLVKMLYEFAGRKV